MRCGGIHWGGGGTRGVGGTPGGFSLEYSHAPASKRAQPIAPAFAKLTQLAQL